MGEKPDQIERQIAQQRTMLSDNLGELEGKVRAALDWRTQFKEHPGTALAIAFGGGIVLSALLPSVGRRSGNSGGNSAPGPERNYAPPSYSTYTAPAPSTSGASSSSAPNKPSEVRKTMEAFTIALLGIAANQASGLLDSVLPGFQQEFTKVRASRNAHSENLHGADSGRQASAARLWGSEAGQPEHFGQRDARESQDPTTSELHSPQGWSAAAKA